MSNDICGGKRAPRHLTMGNYAKNDAVYTTPFCSSSYKNGNRILHEYEPKNIITRLDICPFNNGCGGNETYTYLNQRGAAPSPYFTKKPGEFLKSTYFSEKPDGRLVDAGRGGFTQTFDSVPIQVVYDLIHDNISQNKALNSYGRNYEDYRTVVGGDIQYYIDKEIADPFIKPVYAFKTDSTGVEWTDPMSAKKVQFNKSYNKEDRSCLSWVNDSCSHRDDITSLQQRKFNEQRYDLLYNRT